MSVNWQDESKRLQMMMTDRADEARRLAAIAIALAERHGQAGIAQALKAHDLRFAELALGLPRW